MNIDFKVSVNYLIDFKVNISSSMFCLKFIDLILSLNSFDAKLFSLKKRGC